MTGEGRKQALPIRDGGVGDVRYRPKADLHERPI